MEITNNQSSTAKAENVLLKKLLDAKESEIELLKEKIIAKEDFFTEKFKAVDQKFDMLTEKLQSKDEMIELLKQQKDTNNSVKCKQCSSVLHKNSSSEFCDECRIKCFNCKGVYA